MSKPSTMLAWTTLILLLVMFSSVGYDSALAADRTFKAGAMGAQLAPTAARFALYGFSAVEGSGGVPSVRWETGNLGKAWSEGEWVPYQLVITSIPAGLVGLDSIAFSYDFAYPHGGDVYRFVDLVRGVQVGTTPLTDSEGWPGPGGAAMPMTTMAELDEAQNLQSEYFWSSFLDLNLPNSQVNRTITGGLDVPQGEALHIIRINKADLLAAGVDPNASTLVIYFQLHLARTFVWQAQLQEGYDTPPADDWGGYLYGTGTWPTAPSVVGSGYVPGSSGHVGMEYPVAGRTVGLPIPEPAPGEISGYKWHDLNVDGVKDAGEPGISGWEIHVSGAVEGVVFARSETTGVDGYYLVDDLTSASSWTLKEDSQRDVPPETGYFQTYPSVGTMVGTATGIAVSPPPSGVASVGWLVNLTNGTPVQENVNFGNRRYQAGITCPPDITIACGESTDPSNTGEPVVTGVCPCQSSPTGCPPTVTYDDYVIPGACPQEYIIERTWTAYCPDTDISAICVQLITVEDNQAPTLTCAGDKQIGCMDPVIFDEPTLSDNCDPDPVLRIVSTVTNPGPGDCAETHTRTWEAEDACGNSVQCSQNIVQAYDETPPLLSCAGDKRLGCNADIVFDDPTVSDNCDPSPSLVVISTVTDAGPGPCEETHIRTWEAEDACGNTAQCSQQIVRVVDQEPPMLECQPDKRIACNADVVFDDPVVFDNCDSEPSLIIVSTTMTPGPGLCEETHVRTWEAEDACGNTAQCSQEIVRVFDQTPPTLTCGADIQANCNAPVIFDDPTVTDNCDPDPVLRIVSTDVVPGPGRCEETHTRTWEAEDACGNTSQCSQNIVRIFDETAPTLTCAPDKQIGCLESPEFDAPTVSDDCDSDPLLTVISTVTVPGPGPCNQTHTRTWEAEDACGNTARCSQNIVQVLDQTPPVITCGPNRQIACNAEVVFDTPVVSDNCDASPSLVILSTTVEPGPGACEETHTRVWQAQDACNNTASCSQTITRVVDGEAPVLTAAPDKVLPCNAEVTFDAPGITDNCDQDPVLDVVSSVVNPGGEPCVEVHTRAWIGRDACGNESDTVYQNVTVKVDTEPPVLVCAPDKTIPYGQEPIFDEPTATDNCTISSAVVQTGNTHTSDPSTLQEVYEQCWIIADDCGNLSNECCQRITVQAPPDPYCTFRCWDWAADCLEDENMPPSTIPACLRDQYFYNLYPAGVIVGAGGHTAVWTSPLAIEEFLCSYGIPKVLARDYVNPKRYELLGVLVGETLCLRLNRDFSCAGYLGDIGFPAPDACYGDYVLPEDLLWFAGLTVDQFLGICDQVVAGNTGALQPYGANIDHLYAAAVYVNWLFSGCIGIQTAPPLLVSGHSGDVEEPAAEPLPVKLALSVRPNPLIGSTTIRLSLPMDAEVSVAVYDIQGRQVATLISDFKTAGHHDIAWDGNDDRGSSLASGVYFCRVQINKKLALMEKLVKL